MRAKKTVCRAIVFFRHVGPGGFGATVRRRGLMTAAALALAVATARAQQAVPSTGPPQPHEGTQIERRLQEQPPPARPTPPSPIAPPGAPPPAAISGTFTVSAVVIDGATVFDPASFVPLYRDLLARPVTQHELAVLAEAVTDMYDAAGYSLSRAYIPPQDIEAGVVHVRVIEGYIDRVTVTGDLARSATLRRYTAPITAERPLRRSTLERQLLLLADLYGVHVDDARLRPIDADAGRYELILDLHVKRYDTYSFLDNRGTRANGPLELWNSIGVNALDGGSWRAQAGFFTVPDSPRELLYFQGGLSHVVDDAGTVVQATLSGSRNRAGPPQQASDTDTGSRRLLLGITHPFVRSREQSLWASFRFDALRSTEDQFHQETFDDQLRVLRPSLYYYVADGLGGENGINLEASYGLNALGASSSGPERSQSDANATFRKVRLDTWRNQKLSGPWSLYGQFAGQLSDRPLLLSEQFSLGGARFGRAYDPAIIAGDRGAAGSVELRFTRPGEGVLSEYQLYGFYDAGGISTGPSDSNTRHRLESAGFGVRLTMKPEFHVNGEIAKPFDSVAGHVDGNWRAFFFLSAAF